MRVDHSPDMTIVRSGGLPSRTLRRCSKYRSTTTKIKKQGPKNKKDQLALALNDTYSVTLTLTSCDRPDPDDPGGLGAEESETERTGPTQ